MLERMESHARAWIVAVLEGTVDGIPLNRERLQLVSSAPRILAHEGGLRAHPARYSSAPVCIHAQPYE